MFKCVICGDESLVDYCDDCMNYINDKNRIGYIEYHVEAPKDVVSTSSLVEDMYMFNEDYVF